MSGESGGLEVGSGTADTGEQLLAVALVVGGAIGVLILTSLISQSGTIALFVLPVALSFVLFGACLWAGWALWRAHPWGRRLATLLIALQIPYISVGDILYQFYTVATLRIAVVFDGSLNASTEIGARLVFDVGSLAPVEYVGVNVLAIGAVWYLLRNR